MKKPKRGFRSDLFVVDLPWVREFTDRLSDAGFEYMVTGSVATMARGEPRFTHDVDLVVRLPFSRISDFEAAFPSPRFYLPPTEVIRGEVMRTERGCFNVIDSECGFKSDCYLMGNDPLNRWAMERRERIEVDGGSIYLAPLEYVVLRKLEWFQLGGGVHHIRDIASALIISGNTVDLSWLESEVATRDLGKGWAQVQDRMRRMSEQEDVTNDL